MKIMFSPNICFILYLFLPMSGHSLLYTGVDSQKKKEEKTKILFHYSGSHILFGISCSFLDIKIYEEK